MNHHTDPQELTLEEYLAQLRQDQQEALDAFWPPPRRNKGRLQRYRNWRVHRRCWRRK
jgi:hypothetical protein